MTQDLQELMDVGGGQTGTTKVPEPVAKKATLPNSKDQGDKSAIKGATSAGYDSVEDTDSENNTKPTGDMSAKNKASISMKSSSASSSMKEEVDELFGEAELTEEFKEKAATIFEAAVNARALEIKEQYEQMLEEQVLEVIEEITTKVDDYMNYVVQEWMAENEVAIESTLRNEISEEFIEGLKNLFAEHYIDIPEDKVDVVEELSSKVEELESKLNETLESNIELNKVLTDFVKDKVFTDVSEGLADTQVDKLKALVEGVDFDDVESYTRKLEIVKDNYFSTKKSVPSMLEEEVNSAEEPAVAPVKLSGPVSSYVHAISRTVKK